MIYLITGHEIRKEGENEVLILHLNYDVEFSLEFYKRKSGKSMKQQIKDYIEKNKIVWNGDKILLVLGGMILGTLLLFQNPISKEEPRYVYVNRTVLDPPAETVLLPKTGLQQESISSKEEINPVEDKTSEKEVNQERKEESIVNSSTQIPTKNKTSTSSITTSQSQIQNQIGNNTEEIKNSVQEKPSEPQLELQPQEQKITIYRSNGTTLVLSMTDYLIGVVAAEMPASFPIEALKAQAVVARTYALKKLESGGKLTDDVSTQVYRDESYLRSIWKNDYDKYYNKIKSAVQATDGFTVKYHGSYIEAIYHSTSNGKTEDAINVWGNSVPYLKSVDSSWDQSASTYLRTVEQELTTVFQILGVPFEEPLSIEILSRNESGRISNVRIGNQNYTGVEFRTLLGLRSSDFDLEVRDGKLVITTRGYGHGVGMSQYGAKGMAENGYSYSKILAHYYPETTLIKE